MAVWPSALPQAPLRADFIESGDNNVLRFETDYGPPKLRRRSTREVFNYQIALVLTTAQVATLETFYDDTLGQVDAFDWLHPRTRAAASFRFRTRPEKRAIGRNWWRVTFMLEDAW